MPEEFLVFLWKYRLFKQPLILTSGATCAVLDPGSRNEHSGPDFLNARIRIDDTLWAGNVEVHVNASDWHKHGHHKDAGYDNVILHVVHLEDKSVRRKSGEAIPTLETFGKYEEDLFLRYRDLVENMNWIPCQGMIASVERMVINNWLDRMLVARLELRTTEVINKLEISNGDWSEAFYQMLARNFGFRVNSLPFDLLAGSLPLKILSKHKNDLEQIEALVFGQAGLLSLRHKDSYFVKLKKEYGFLSEKYGLQPIDPGLWKFMRLRPSNFPTIRLAQFAFLVFSSTHLFSKILETKTLNELHQLFSAGVSEYWNSHYVFGKKSVMKSKGLGKSAINLILVNTVVPFLFTYGKLKRNPDLTDRALKLLEGIPAESNAEIRKWRELGINVRSAFTTQALLELRRSYCNSKKCLDCAIGLQLVQG